jgi:hypothetical protein
MALFELSVLKFLSSSQQNEKRHPAFDYLVGVGYAFGDLTVLIIFRFDRGVIVGVPGLVLNWGPPGLLLFHGLILTG